MWLLPQTFPEFFFLICLQSLWHILLNILKSDKYSLFVGDFDFGEKDFGMESSSWDGGWGQGVLAPPKAM